MGIKTETVFKDGVEGRTIIEDFKDEYGTLPAKFWFNGASAPSLLWRWVPPFKNEAISARHDFDCSLAQMQMDEAKDWYARGMGETGNGWVRSAKKTRELADKRYRAGMVKSRGKFIGYSAWIGVRIGSFFGVGWKKDKK